MDNNFIISVSMAHWDFGHIFIDWNAAISFINTFDADIKSVSYKGSDNFYDVEVVLI